MSQDVDAAAAKATVAAAPGWYDDGSGRQRWWDGAAWQMYAPVQQAVPVQYAGREANRMPVSYTRPQTGHSIIKAICLDWITCYIRTIYWSVSPNHYWHA